MKARSVECRCTNNFTCGYCLRNAKPWHYTLSDGSAIIPPPADFTQPAEDLTSRIARARAFLRSCIPDILNGTRGQADAEHRAVTMVAQHGYDYETVRAKVLENSYLPDTSK
jgi:hypothetical protein